MLLIALFYFPNLKIAYLKNCAYFVKMTPLCVGMHEIHTDYP